MRLGIRFSLMVLMAAALLASGLTVRAEEEGVREDILALQSYRIWQRINEARHNPMAVLARLAIPEEQARAVLGEDAWLLDTGLRPLAWDDTLVGAAALHGRDMLARLYYSHATPEGLIAADRVAAAGYQALLAGETLGLLGFYNPIDLDKALDIMVDQMLRDELTGTPGVVRNIFSPRLTEAGISFFAETVEQIAGQPYLYLMVADFASPAAPRGFIIGKVDPGHGAVQRTFSPVADKEIPLLPGRNFQVPCPPFRGIWLYAVNGAGEVVNDALVFDPWSIGNSYVDLRTSP